ncbi:MAG: hypothetical protein CVV21_07900 [Candidatus Goldiibacteriota bacterium HGW-Goldbacteria-1]|nr:MAG: hypothetical protein CVV21_07900 [Candidatus Goldiibacteriota bacterium HGW-Goldbacteria-1]
MKKLTVILLSALLVSAFLIACNKNSPSSPQAEQATATPIGTFTVTPTITATSTITQTSTVTPTVTLTATMDCGIKFGSNSNSSSGSSGPNNLYAHKFTPNAETSVTALSIEMAAAGKYCIGIYSDNSGTPGSMLAWTGVKTAASAGWFTSSLSTPYILTAGTDFWFVFSADEWVPGSTDAAYTSYSRYVGGETTIAAIETAGVMPSGGTWTTFASYRHHLYASGCSY